MSVCRGYLRQTNSGNIIFFVISMVHVHVLPVDMYFVHACKLLPVLIFPQAKEDSNHTTVNETLKRMKPHIDELFYKDLPFYLVFAYRLHIRYTFYQCDEMGTFIAACLKKIESLNYKQLAQTINDFAKR